MSDFFSERVALALDVSSPYEARTYALNANQFIRHVKVGLELFISGGGNRVLGELYFSNRIFLDLKLHDIPTTVEKTCRVIRNFNRHNLKMITVHGAGGKDMVNAAKQAVGDDIKIIVVSTLTSSDPTYVPTEISFWEGTDGVVCPASLAKTWRWYLGPTRVIVCPGIRSEGSPRNDQKQTATPKEALENGADYLVVGRPFLSGPKEEFRRRCQNLMREIRQVGR